MAFATTAVSQADELFDSAMAQIEQGELRVASGMLWDATAAAFTALAKRRGWTISKHRRYEDVYSKIKPELPGDRLFRGFNSAVIMERNWVEDYDLSESWVRNSAGRVRSMIDALQSV